MERKKSERKEKCLKIQRKLENKNLSFESPQTRELGGNKEMPRGQMGTVQMMSDVVYRKRQELTLREHLGIRNGIFNAIWKLVFGYGANQKVV